MMRIDAHIRSKKRKHLTSTEVQHLLAATQGRRHEARDYCLLLLMFRHGLRVSEASHLQLDQLDLEGKQIYVYRLKGSLSTTQPLQPDEMRAIESWLSARPLVKNPYVFLSERNALLTRQAIYQMIRHYGELAGLSIQAHPHMLRHACGFALADQGADTRLIQDYLGHRNISHTVLYTASNSERFKRLWRPEATTIHF